MGTERLEPDKSTSFLEAVEPGIEYTVDCSWQRCDIAAHADDRPSYPASYSAESISKNIILQGKARKLGKPIRA